MTTESICFNCKRSLNTEELPCSWAAYLHPVDKWTAIPHIYHIEKTPVQGYQVISCPLYIKDKEYTTYAEAAKYIAKELGCTVSTIYYNWKLALSKYETKTGNKLPKWLWYRQEDQLMEEEDETRDNT